jgi:Uma2 family endonuclease
MLLRLNGIVTMSTPTIAPTQSARSLPALAAGPTGGSTSRTTWGHDDLYRITVDEYERTGGLLDDPRVELIDGYLVKKMSKKPPHISTVKAVYTILSKLLPKGWTWQKEDPIRIPDLHEPEPDVTVLRGSDEDYRGRIPDQTTVSLVVEVADTTLDRDRGPKLLAYAEGRIPIYWIVNLVDWQVEVYSDPAPDGYRSVQIFRPGRFVPVVIDGVEIGRLAMADILRDASTPSG